MYILLKHKTDKRLNKIVTLTKARELAYELGTEQDRDNLDRLKRECNKTRTLLDLNLEPLKWAEWCEQILEDKGYYVLVEYENIISPDKITEWFAEE